MGYTTTKASRRAYRVHAFAPRVRFKMCMICSASTVPFSGCKPLFAVVSSSRRGQNIQVGHCCHLVPTIASATFEWPTVMSRCVPRMIGFASYGVPQVLQAITSPRLASINLPSCLFLPYYMCQRTRFHIPRERQDDASNGPSLPPLDRRRAGSTLCLAPAPKLLRKRQGPYVPVPIEPANSSPCEAWDENQIRAGNQEAGHLLAGLSGSVLQNYDGTQVLLTSGTEGWQQREEAKRFLSARLRFFIITPTNVRMVLTAGEPCLARRCGEGLWRTQPGPGTPRTLSHLDLSGRRRKKYNSTQSRLQYYGCGSITALPQQVRMSIGEVASSNPGGASFLEP